MFVEQLAIGCVSRSIAGIPNRAGSYEDVAKDPGVDICYIGMLHPFHYENAMAALHNGKHVLVEKPSTCTESDTKELVRLVRVSDTKTPRSALSFAPIRMPFARL